MVHITPHSVLNRVKGALSSEHCAGLSIECTLQQQSRSGGQGMGRLEARVHLKRSIGRGGGITAPVVLHNLTSFCFVLHQAYKHLGPLTTPNMPCPNLNNPLYFRQKKKS